MQLLRPLVILGLALGSPPIAPALESGATVRAWSVDDEEPIEVELIDLTSIDWEPGKEVPEEIRKLDGKKVRIKGVMALGTVEGVDNFQLVSDGCNCGTGKIHHFVKVTLADDVTTYSPDEITVTGTFSVGEVEEDGFVTSLYRLNESSIE